MKTPSRGEPPERHEPGAVQERAGRYVPIQLTEKAPRQPRRVNLEVDIRNILNRHSEENVSDTPDHILARYLINCLDAFNKATFARDEYWGANR